MRGTALLRPHTKVGREGIPLCRFRTNLIGGEMDKEKELPQRKHTRLQNFDYSTTGAYFITICTKDRRCVLSKVVGRGQARNPQSSLYSLRGTPRAPAEVQESAHALNGRAVGRGLAPAETNGIEYTSFGKIAEHQLLLLEERYPFLSVDQYVIMPNHIHVILILDNQAAGASPRPTVMDIVCAFKSLTTRECKKNGFHGSLFQTSFYDHVIRDREDYARCVKYIYENPMRWYYDELYVEE